MERLAAFFLRPGSAWVRSARARAATDAARRRAGLCIECGGAGVPEGCTTCDDCYSAAAW